MYIAISGSAYISGKILLNHCCLLACNCLLGVWKAGAQYRVNEATRTHNCFLITLLCLLGHLQTTVFCSWSLTIIGILRIESQYHLILNTTAPGSYPRSPCGTTLSPCALPSVSSRRRSSCIPVQRPLCCEWPRLMGDTAVGEQRWETPQD